MTDPATPSRDVDPGLAANVYAGGHLDRLIARAVTPFRKELLRVDPHARLWAIRYNRRGEHLKLRVHSASDPASAETLLREATQRFLGELPERPAAPFPAPRFDVPAIDPEDEGEDPAADRALVRTTYRRSPTTLGSRTVRADDGMVDAMYRALAAGFELLLDVSEDELEKQRRNRLLKVFIFGLSATLPDLLEWPTYLDYHRDCLLRFFLREHDREEELRKSFARRLATMQPAIEVLRHTVTSPPTSEPTDPWATAMAMLAERLACMPDELELDPFARSPGHPVLFKVLHGIANVSGVPPLDEAFLCHLLRHACAATAWPPRASARREEGDAPEGTDAATAIPARGIATAPRHPALRPGASRVPETDHDAELPWTHFIRRQGGAAEAWVREYERHQELHALQFRALLSMRRRRLEEGRRQLAEYENRLDQAAETGTSLRFVLERYLHSVLGFYHYCRKDWEAAERAMNAARHAAVRAIETDAFLITQANSCYEFCLQKARIARNAERWETMFRHIDAARAMASGDAPLCVLADGTEICYETLVRFYRSLGELDPRERIIVDRLTTAESRLHLLEGLIRRILAFPELAIQYP